MTVAALMVVALVVSGTFTDSSVSSGVTHVNDVALTGSNTSGFAGAVELSGLGDDAVTIAEYSESVGVPAELVLALVARSSGPWRAADSDVVGNARTVTGALTAAKDATQAPAGWDMLAGTVACSGDVLVIEGQSCPDGFQTEAGDGLRQARLVREAWVSALMAMGDGLPAPQTAPGSAGGSGEALAAPDDLSGQPSEMISTLATSTYGLEASAVSVDGDQVTVTTSEPLPLATTIVSRYEEIGVVRLEAGGQSWEPTSGWQAIEPEVGTTTEEDPTATGHVRVWTCTGSGCPTEPGTQEQEEPTHLTREQADEIYSLALSWRLGSAPATCTTSTTTSAAASTSVTSVSSSTSGETIEITPTRAGYVSAVIGAGRQKGVSDDGILVALMVVLQESRLNMYANSTIPESLSITHDAVGHDHDSVGLFQQRPSMGWGGGDVAALMDAGQSAGFFFDAYLAENPSGSLGQQAQAVQVSAFPDAYDQWEEAARQLAGGVSGSVSTPGCTQAATSTDTTGWRYPIVSVGTITSPWNPARVHPVLGVTRPHWGTDIAGLPIGTDLVAVADGTVTYAACGSGGLCAIMFDTTDGWRIRYLHIVAGSWTVSKGDTITAGQVIAKLGNTGVGTGAHLHVETSPLDKIGDAQWCPFDATWTDRCTNPVETFAAHGVDLATGTVTPVAGSTEGAGLGSGSTALEWARTKVGGPYVWGGTGPTGYDCSGLVQAAWAQAGVSLPRVSQDQCRTGTPVDPSQAQAGDIVCWGSPAYHVALYDGAGGIVGAQNLSDGITTKPLYGDYYIRRVTQ